MRKMQIRDTSGIAGRTVRRGLATLAAGLCLAAAAVRAETTGNVTWSGGGGAGNPYWNVAANWVGNDAPANPTPGIVTFGHPGQAVMSTLEADRSVNQLYSGFYSNGVGYVCTHTLDLGGYKLNVTNRLQVVTSYQARRNTLNITNGTLRIGTATAPGNITVNAAGTLCFKPGVRLDPYNLHTLSLGANAYATTEMDLRGAEVVGGTLTMRRLYMNGTGWYGNRMLLDSATSVDAIEVTEVFELARANVNNNTPQYIGNPSDTFAYDAATFGKLPAGIGLTVGVSESQRATMWVAEDSGGHSRVRGVIRAAAGGGGAFTAYLSTLKIGVRSGTGARYPRGMLHLAEMDSCLLDVQSLEIAPGRTGAQATDNEQGELWLPPGTATIGTATLGADGGVGFGRLALSNTVFSVTNSLALRKTAAVTATVGATPSGLNLSGAFVDGGGTIHVNFNTAPSVATNWAIRIAGDARNALNAMIGQGRLTRTIGGAVTGKKTGIVTDDDYTYFALVDDSLVFPPVAIAQDVTFEIVPDGVVLVDVSEVDDGSFDPEDLETPPQLRLIYDGGSPTNQLAFTAAGNYPVTLVANILDGEGHVVASATDTATITVAAPPAGTQSSVEWNGAADTVLMSGRREWFWSGNWVGGVPPANPTAGTIVYRTQGQSLTGRLDADRTITGLDAGQGEFVTAHTIDLASHTLTIKGLLRLLTGGTSTDWSRTTRLTFTNGTVQLGGDTTVTVSVGTGCTLKFAPGTVVNVEKLGTLGMGPGNTANSVVDLRGAAVAGGVLRASVIDMPTIAWFVSLLYLDNATAVNRIEAVSALRLGRGEVGGTSWAYIGNPGDTVSKSGGLLGRLPAGVSLAVGTGTTARASELVVAEGTGYSWNSYDLAGIAAAPGGGGTFTGYLSSLKIGTHTGTAECRPYGVLDLTAMDGCLLDTLSLEMATGRAGALSTDNERGELRLPSGTAVVGTALIGAPAGVGFGLLETSNTVFAVTNALTLQKTAVVTNRIASASSGFDITPSDSGALTVASGAKLVLSFLAPAASKPHYGLRWAGDHKTALDDMIGDGRLVLDDDGLGREAKVFVNGGYTYVGLPPTGGTVLLVK